MKKRLFSLILVLSIIMLNSITVFAATAPDYAVAGISEYGFTDPAENGYIDINPSNAVDKIALGDTVYFPLVNENWITGINDYKFVYESNAIGNGEALCAVENGKSAINVEGIKIVRIRAINSSSTITYKEIGKTKTSNSTSYIYCVAVPTNYAETTEAINCNFTLAVNCGSSSWKIKVADTAQQYYFEASFRQYSAYEYGDVSEDLNYIQEFPLVFSTANGGFKGTTDDVLMFECDGEMQYDINTYGQKALIISFDREYDEAIASVIHKSYPNAELEFFNGNYARFSKVGMLWLVSYFDYGYVYQIVNDEYLTFKEVQLDTENTEDEYYVFKTNILGRYVISDTPLNQITHLGLKTPPEILEQRQAEKEVSELDKNAVSTEKEILTTAPKTQTVKTNDEIKVDTDNSTIKEISPNSKVTTKQQKTSNVSLINTKSLKIFIPILIVSSIFMGFVIYKNMR